MDEGKISIRYEIKNTWTEDVLLWDANGSCFCTQWYVENIDGTNRSEEFNTIGSTAVKNLARVLRAWETQVVVAIYDPEAHWPNVVWPTMRWLTIKTNSSSTPDLKLNFFGSVVKTRT
jgi:hypothetical protein